MPSRRTHPKTRNGCVLCKKRKVKCDGVPPRCHNCVRYGSACSFAELQFASSPPQYQSAPANIAFPPAKTDQENVGPEEADCSEIVSISTTPSERHSCKSSLDLPSSIGSSSSSSDGSADGFFAAVNFSRQSLLGLHRMYCDEELLNNYMASTYLSISNKYSVQEAYRTAIPEEALSHEHLMHAMLGFSAAHLMHTQPDRRALYERKARRHQHLSLLSSIPEMANMNLTNCHALFATAGITAILAFTLQSPIAFTHTCLLDDMVDFFVLVRGIKSVLRGAYFDYIIQGKLKALVDYDLHPPTKPLQGDIKDVFHRLAKLNMQAVRLPDLQETYTAVTYSLQRAFETYNVIKHERSLALGVWSASLPDLYLFLLRKREPMALTILAHYGVLLHSINGIWWSEGRGLRLVEAITENLPTAWHPEVEWPNAVVRGQCALIIGM